VCEFFSVQTIWGTGVITSTPDGDQGKLEEGQGSGGGMKRGSLEGRNRKRKDLPSNCMETGRNTLWGKKNGEREGELQP